jgi:Recombinase zinc beta ribbon domain
MAANPKKKYVISLIRVSTSDQDLQRQRWLKKKILEHFGLEELPGGECALKVSGTVVEKTAEYRQAMELLKRRDVTGFCVVSIDRWFRYKKISEIGRYVEPFEEMNEGVNKLIYSKVRNEFYALDLRVPKDQDIILDAVRQASREREDITERFTTGKEMLRELPDAKVDDLPDGVKFRRYDQDKVDAGLLDKKDSINKGIFWYTDWAKKTIPALFDKFLAGASFYEMSIEFGFKTPAHVRHCLKNQWWIGNKHRTKHIARREWSKELNRLRSQDKGEHPNSLVVPANLVDPKTGKKQQPLISEDTWKAAQEKFKSRSKGSKEYSRRKKQSNHFLAHPLLRCENCNAPMYGKAGDERQNRHDIYYCSTGYRFNTCDGQKFNRRKLDDALALDVVLYLTQNNAIDQKLIELKGEDHRAEIQAKVDRLKRAAADIEKKADRVRRLAEEADDPKSGVRLKELNLELASANEATRRAEEELDAVPDYDVEEMRRRIARDFADFGTKKVDEQKQILKTYLTRIVAHENEVTGRITFKWDFQISAPPLEEYEYEPIVMKPIQPTDGTPIRVKRGGTIGGALPTPLRRTKSGSHYSASSRPFCSNRWPTGTPAGSSPSRRSGPKRTTPAMSPAEITSISLPNPLPSPPRRATTAANWRSRPAARLSSCGPTARMRDSRTFFS